MSRTKLDTDLERASQVVSQRLGLHFSKARERDLCAALELAGKELEHPPEAGLTWMLRGSLSAREIDVLSRHLTIGETYFFRESGVFSGLEREVLPDLLRKRRSSRVLRIWSAGCCTGEEPYSLAILLDRLMPDRLAWEIVIAATDLNPEFLARAKRGIYSDWSFRDVSPEIREAYFIERGAKSSELLPRIRKRVTFSQLNLVDPAYPSLTDQIHDFDLIFCRNVLMYFAPDRALEVVSRLRASLVEGGYLVVSPSEVSQSLFSNFRAVRLEEATFYQRSNAEPLPTRPVEMPSSAREPLPTPRNSTVRSRPAPAEIEPSKTVEASDNSEASPSRGTPPEAASLVDCAKSAADGGHLEEALLLVEKALALNKLDARTYHLRATILAELERPLEAAHALRTTLYLDPKFVLAHFALGHLCLKQGARDQARRQFSNVLSLLGEEPDDALLPDSDGLTAGGLKQLSQAQLDVVK